MKVTYYNSENREKLISYESKLSVDRYYPGAVFSFENIDGELIFVRIKTIVTGTLPPNVEIMDVMCDIVSSRKISFVENYYAWGFIE